MTRTVEPQTPRMSVVIQAYVALCDPLRLLRPLIPIPRDLISLALLSAGGLRYPSLLV